MTGTQVERVLLDEQGNTLLNLYRCEQGVKYSVKTEQLPELTPVGSVEDVPGTGLRLYVGPDLLKAGQYTLTVGTYGKSHDVALGVQREVINAARRTRGVWRNGTVLPIARFSRISRSFLGVNMLGGAVEVVFEAASAYWWGEMKSRMVAPTGTTLVTVGGEAPVSLRVSIHAETQDVVDPVIVSSAGTTTWHGTVPVGQTLVIDGLPGNWSVTLNGLDVTLGLSGPQPYMEAGESGIALTADGGLVEIGWQEGWLGGVAGLVPPPSGSGLGGVEQWTQEDWV